MMVDLDSTFLYRNVPFVLFLSSSLFIAVPILRSSSLAEPVFPCPIKDRSPHTRRFMQPRVTRLFYPVELESTVIAASNGNVRNKEFRQRSDGWSSTSGTSLVVLQETASFFHYPLLDAFAFGIGPFSAFSRRALFNV